MSDELSRLLPALAGLRDHGEWQPRRFDADDADDRAALAALIASGAIGALHDSLGAQLAELIEVRAPDRKLAPAELAILRERHLGGRDPSRYGSWIHYPWSRRLVHVLPRDEYVEVRTSRNRNKITAAEQAKLGALTVGVAGLSVGQATAITLALEGVGGRFRLADFDTINLSNLNRLRAGAHAIGVNKAVLTAREIFELNPYAEVTLFPDGVRDDNLDAFLRGLDLLFEECDDLKMKVRLREAARQHRVPVLMETSDRGLFDLERFDLEPERPIFHGLTGELRAQDLEGLSTFEKIPVVLKIIGERTMSPRMAASLVDVETTIKSWPQLASAVALGGAVNTDAARRVVLGELRSSGRFFVDLGELIADGTAATLDTTPTPAPTPPPVRPPVPALRGTGLGGVEQVRAIVARGALAPSGGNCQPWRFVWKAPRLDCFLDRARGRSFLDFAEAASHLAMGAAVENMVLSAGAIGLGAALELFPDGEGAERVCTITLSPGPSDGDLLAEQIEARATNRKIAARTPLTDDERVALLEAAGAARLTLVEDEPTLAELADLLGRGDRVRFLSESLHREMMSEIRWSSAEALRSRDGLDLPTLELQPSDLAGLRLVSRWPIMEMVGRLGGGAGLEKATRKAVAGAAALGLVTVPGASPRSYFEGGRKLERVWLTATELGLAFQPMTALVYLFSRLERGNGDGFSAAERAELTALRERWNHVFEVEGQAEIMLFRVGRAGAPSARSLRRDLDEFLFWG